MKIRLDWKITLALISLFLAGNVYYFYVLRYTAANPEPSRPQANQTTTPTASPTGSNPSSSTSSLTLDQIVDYLTDNYETIALSDLLDARYSGVTQEIDPVWIAQKGNYYSKTQIQSLLNDKASSSALGSYYTKTQTEGLVAGLSTNTHTHDDRYYSESEIVTLLGGKSDTTHTHDDRYYTESELVALLAGKSDTNHNHNDLYYTESETNSAITASNTKGGYTSLLPIQRNYARLDGMESGWSNFYGNGTVSFDTTDYYSGTAAVKVVTSSNASNSGARKTLSGNEDWTGKFVKIHVKADNWNNLTEVKLLVSTNGQFVSYYQASLKPLLTYPSDHNNEWVEFVIPTSHFTTSGSPSWTTVNQLIVRGIGVNGTTPTLWFDEYATVSNTTTGAMLSFTFDDGHSSDYGNARAVMDSKGYKRSIFVIPSLLETAGYLTQTQLDFLHNNGWEISGHGNTNLTTLSLVDAETDVSSVKDYLQSRGYRGAEIYAYPNGGHNSSLRTMIQKYFSLARTIVEADQPITYMNPMTLHSKVVHSTDSTATVQGWIDAAVANKEWLILTFHRISDSTPATTTEYSKTNFQTVVDYVNTSGIQVLPMSQALRRMQSY